MSECLFLNSKLFLMTFKKSIYLRLNKKRRSFAVVPPPSLRSLVRAKLVINFYISKSSVLKWIFYPTY